MEQDQAWAERFAPTCSNHPDLAAVFESPWGRLAVLLRHTLVPLTEEHPMWLAETRASVRRLLADLRASGLRGRVIVVQWVALARADEILTTWRCRYESDAVRRAQLAGVARRYVLDERFLVACTAKRSIARATPRPDRESDILVGAGPWCSGPGVELTEDGDLDRALGIATKPPSPLRP